MAEVTKPIALDESFNTTESTPRNTADVLAEGLDAIATAIENGGGGGGGASTVSQLTDVLLSATIPDGDVLVRDNNLTGGKLWKNKTITVELTQAEYDQLVADDEVLPDVDYYITDAPSMQGTSADLSYDGTTLSTHDKIEGLNASNLPITSGSVQNTKDYIDSGLSGKANTSTFAKKSVSLSEYVSISGNTIDTQSFSVNDATYGIICGFAVTNTPEVVVMQCYFDGTSTIYLRVRNVSASTQSYKATIYYI